MSKPIDRLAIMTAYRQGIINRGEVVRRLKELGYTARDARMLAGLQDARADSMPELSQDARHARAVANMRSIRAGWDMPTPDQSARLPDECPGCSGPVDPSEVYHLPGGKCRCHYCNRVLSPTKGD